MNFWTEFNRNALKNQFYFFVGLKEKNQYVLDIKNSKTKTCFKVKMDWSID